MEEETVNNKLETENPVLDVELSEQISTKLELASLGKDLLEILDLLDNKSKYSDGKALTFNRVIKILQTRRYLSSSHPSFRQMRPDLVKALENAIIGLDFTTRVGQELLLELKGAIRPPPKTRFPKTPLSLVKIEDPEHLTSPPPLLDFCGLISCDIAR